MIAAKTHIGTVNMTGAKVRDYMALLKFRLSMLVAFSSAFGYVVGTKGQFNWLDLLMLSLGGMLVSGASITLNQIQEKEYDKMMKRTCDRPLPTGRVSVREAYVYALVVALVGFTLLWLFTNPLTTALSLLSLILYAFAYTPLKRVGPIAVLVGAVPGALPPLLGWVAATGYVGLAGLVIFAIQFFWQFPHFWAIAWVADEDYKKAGFKLLPGSGKKDFDTAIKIMIYTLFLIPLGILPAQVGITGINSAVVATICGVLFLSQTLSLMKDGSRKSALKIMFGSFFYLPIVQIAYLLDLI